MTPNRTARCVVAMLLVSRVAGAFTPELHERLSLEAQRTAGAGAGTIVVPDLAGASRFWPLLWAELAATGDERLRARFLLRFPDPASFDAVAVKRLLFLNTTRPVLGLDRFEGLPDSRPALLAAASRWPDDDDRNADRFWRAPDGSVRLGPDGVPLPEDPAILDMGGATGVSSQAHARYALLPVSRRTDATEVLEKEPWRFSVPRNARAFGGDFAGMYDDLSLVVAGLAGASGEEAPFFAASFLGLGWHHVQEAATQTQTVQVPSGDLFVGAQLSVWIEELRVGGGLFGPRVSVREVAVRALTHFHLFHERLFADTVLACAGGCADPAVSAAVRAMSESDEVLEKRLREARASGRSLALTAVEALVEVGAPEAKVVHDHVRLLADPSIFAWRGREVTDADDPLAFLVAPVQELEKTEAWRGFFEVRARGFRRFNAFVRAQQGAGPGSDVGTVRDRLLRRLLDRHEEMEARRASFVPPDATVSGLNKGVVTGLAALLVLALFAARSLLRKRAPPRPPWRSAEAPTVPRAT